MILRIRKNFESTVHGLRMAEKQKVKYVRLSMTSKQWASKSPAWVLKAIWSYWEACKFSSDSDSKERSKWGWQKEGWAIVWRSICRNGCKTTPMETRKAIWLIISISTMISANQRSVLKYPTELATERFDALLRLWRSDYINWVWMWWRTRTSNYHGRDSTHSS